MRRTAGPRLEGYAILAAAGLVTALVLRRAELAVAAAPFALALAIGLRTARDPRVEIALALDAERTLEDRPVGAELTVRAAGPVDRLELMLDLPEGVEVVDEDNATAIRLRRDEARRIDVELRCRRWGVYEIGGVEIRARGVLRLVVWERRLELG